MLKNLLATLSFIINHPLNRRHRFASIVGFVRWQIGTRLLGTRVIVPWVEDSQLIVGRGEAGLTGNLYCGFVEYEEMLLVLHTLQPEDLFLDVGANIGAFTILAAKVVGANTMAFEPIAATAAKLADQIQLNGIGHRVEIRNAGVGARAERLYFTNNSDTVNKVSSAGPATTEVAVIRLDDCVRPDRRIALKIDVEGFEYEVLRGAANLLTSPHVRTVIVELNGSGKEFGHSNEEVHELVVANGFVPISYDPLGRRVTQLQSYNRNGGNTIYVRDVDETQRLVSSAPFRSVHTAHGQRL